MRLSQIYVLITVLALSVISCRDTMGEQHNSLPKENAVPSTRQKPMVKPADNSDTEKPVETPLDKEIKKKKKRATDTLRPLVAIP